MRMSNSAATSSSGQRLRAIDDSYLERGLTGLSRVVGHSGLMDGHWGAAVITGCLFARDLNLDEPAQRAVRRQMDLVIAKFPVLFEPHPSEAPDPSLIGQIPAALETNINRLRLIGHNVIFAALALRAIREMPKLATPGTIRGVSKLVKGFDGTGPGGPHLGSEDHEVAAAIERAEREYLPYADEQELATAAVRGFVAAEPVCWGMHQGTVGHILTHADSLCQLAELGYPELAKRGHAALRVQIELATKPYDPVKCGQKVRTPVPESTHLRAEYWEKDLGNWAYGHCFKYPYHFHRLLKKVKDEALIAQAVRKFPILM
jgi:hypothetical protein